MSDLVRVPILVHAPQCDTALEMWLRRRSGCERRARRESGEPELARWMTLASARLMMPPRTDGSPVYLDTLHSFSVFEGMRSVLASDFLPARHPYARMFVHATIRFVECFFSTMRDAERSLATEHRWRQKERSCDLVQLICSVYPRILGLDPVSLMHSNFGNLLLFLLQALQLLARECRQLIPQRREHRHYLLHGPYRREDVVITLVGVVVLQTLIVADKVFMQAQHPSE